MADSSTEQPVGYCQCGCGQKAPISRRTDSRFGLVKGQPARFVAGHQRRCEQHPKEPNPSGFCLCGCGQKTPLAPQTVARDGWVKGQPLRYVKGHQCRKQGLWSGEHEDPNPSGLCQCGCGEQVTTSKTNNRFLGMRKGDHYRYLIGHQSRKSPVPYVVEEVTGCWIWQWSSGDYGTYWPDGSKGQKWQAHRWYYTQAFGPIPEGLEIHHKCRNKLCVNPEHLVALKPSVHRIYTRAARVPATQCKNGHPYTPENTLRKSNGVRVCRTCRAVSAFRFAKAELEKLGLDI